MQSNLLTGLRRCPCSPHPHIAEEMAAWADGDLEWALQNSTHFSIMSRAAVPELDTPRRITRAA